MQVYDDKQKTNTKIEETERVSKPNYYTVMPAIIRYDNRLKPNEKILYSEIVTLASKNGYCYASNKYLAELYGVSIVTISNWINNLINLGYLKYENEYLEGTKYITKRKLYPVDDDILKKSLIYSKENFNMDIKEIFKGDIKENFKDNNTSINNTSINNIYSRADGKNKKLVSEVIDYLNEKAGKSYKPTTQKTISLISARSKEGFTLNDFKKVINTKTQQWKSNADMNKYLRPETLFGTKFESYLQEDPNLSNNNQFPNKKNYKPDIENELKKYGR